MTLQLINFLRNLDTHVFSLQTAQLTRGETMMTKAIVSPHDTLKMLRNGHTKLKIRPSIRIFLVLKLRLKIVNRSHKLMIIPKPNIMIESYKFMTRFYSFYHFMIDLLRNIHFLLLTAF